MHTEAINTDRDLGLLHEAMKAHWPGFLGLSRQGEGANVETFAHFAESRPADFASVIGRVTTPLLMTVADNKAQVTANGTDSALIAVVDPRIAADSAVEYFVDLDGVNDVTATAAPVVAGRVDLEFVTSVPGRYRIRVQRLGGLDVGAVEIEAV